MTKRVELGLLGLGTVGSGLVELIERNAGMIEQRSDVRLHIKKALVKDPNKHRPLPKEKITFEPDDLFRDAEIDVIVEVMGGMEPARSYIIASLEAGKSVVTANKAVLAAHGAEILSMAAKHRCQVGFEASVCGGIPIVQALSSGLIANRVDRLLGILNGTSNYILTRMSESDVAYEEVVREAQERGFAEADPSFDVEGIDAAHKLLILAELTFQAKASIDEITVEGISRLTQDDVRAARGFGYVIKPIAMAAVESGCLDLGVHPALIPISHPLATVRHEYNAVLVKGDAIGEMIFYGRGAGSLPTASAVLSDIVEIARNPYTTVALWNPDRSVKISPAEARSRFYFRFPIFDRPGLIGKIATVLGDNDISITHAQALLVCNETNRGNVMIVTHEANERAVRKALLEIDSLGILAAPSLAIRILE